jgi:WD40 repeat protein
MPKHLPVYVILIVISLTNALPHARGEQSRSSSPGVRSAVNKSNTRLKLLHTLKGPGNTADDQLQSIAFSPDGKTVACSFYNGTLILWDVQTGLKRRTLSVGMTVSSLAYSPDGKMLAVGTQEGQTVTIWQPSSGTVLRTINIPDEGSSGAIAFSPDGRTLATNSAIGDDSASGGGNIQLWDVRSGTLLRVLSGHRSRVLSVVFSTDGKKLATGSYDKIVRLWDVETGNLLRTLTAHNYPVEQVAFSPDSTTLASASCDVSAEQALLGELILWDLVTNSMKRTLPGRCAAAFSPDGQIIATYGSSWSLLFVNVETGAANQVSPPQHIVVPEGHTGRIVFSPIGRILAAGVTGTQVKLWEIF